MDLNDLRESEIPGAGALAAVLGIGLDLLLNGGELVIALLSPLLGSVDLWLVILSSVERLSSYVPAIPAGAIETLLPIVLAGYIALQLGKLINRITESVSK